jgi:transcriptional regulator of arginine metabolism
VSIKSRRQSRLRDLLSHQFLKSQEEIANHLQRDGIEATQATLSRDLRELGVLKGPEGYMLPAPGANREPARRELQRALASFMQSAKRASNIVVVRTGIGQASALATEIDRAGLDGAVGTVAGDDTIFIATTTATQATRIVKLFQDLSTRP